MVGPWENIHLFLLVILLLETEGDANSSREALKGEELA